MTPTSHPQRWVLHLVFCSLVCLSASAGAPDQALASVAPGADVTAPEVACGREFATIGGFPNDRLRIDPSGAENLGNEIGRFWASNNSGQANNFDGSCPSQSAEQIGGGWWELSQAPLRGIRGLIGEPGCVTAGCPDGPLTVLVEEPGEDAWDTPYFIALQVDPTPSELRWWDLSRVDPSPSPSVLTLHPFPTIQITGSSSLGSNLIQIDFVAPDIAANVHAVSGPGVDTSLPASGIVRSYDVYQHVGDWSPGPFAEDWSLVQQFPYEDGPVVGSFVMDCSFGAETEHFALGLSFDGGEGLEVPSRLVAYWGQSECNHGASTSGWGLIEYGESPCFPGDNLLLKSPCSNSARDLLSSEIDLEAHLCELVFLQGFDPFFETGICPNGVIDPEFLEPIEAPCRVQVRELTAGRDPEELRLRWAPLPCSDDYDVIRGNLDELSEGGLGAVLCIENDTVLLETTETTGQDPDPGDGFCYLVRSRGAVGSLHYGYTSAETPRLPTLGDCPLD